MKKHVINQIQTYTRKHIKLICILSILLIFLFEDALLVYNRLNNDHPILGQKLNNVNVSTFSKAQILSFLSNQLTSTSPLQLVSDGKIIAIRRKDVGAKVNHQKTLNLVYGAGRNGNLFQNIIDQNKAALGLSNIRMMGQVSKPLLILQVLGIEEQINKDSQPSMPDFSSSSSATIPQKNGIKVLSSQLSSIIQNNIFTPPSEPIAIPTQKIVKNYASYDMNMIKTQAQDYTQEPISITSGGIVFTLSPTDLKSLLTISEQPDPNNPKKTTMNLSLNHTKLNHMLYPYANKVEAVTNAEFNHHDTLAAIFGQFYTNTRRVVEVPTGSTLGNKVLAESVNTGGKTIYLTFDDGPNIIYHPMVLDILKEKGVKATFYLVGSNSKLYASTTKRTIQEGHAIGDHSLTHAYLAKLLPNQIFDEIKTTKDILESYLPPDKKITLFRPPYGGTNALVQKDANTLGLKQELWTVDPKDWSEPTTDELVIRVVNKAQNGSVVLLHSNHFSTIKALPTIIDKLRGKGFTFQVQQ